MNAICINVVAKFASVISMFVRKVDAFYNVGWNSGKQLIMDWGL